MLQVLIVHQLSYHGLVNSRHSEGPISIDKMISLDPPALSFFMLACNICFASSPFQFKLHLDPAAILAILGHCVSFQIYKFQNLKSLKTEYLSSVLKPSSVERECNYL